MQERQAMAQEIERLQHEEQLSALEKKQRAAALMEEVAAANAQQIERKKQLAEQEREEEARIAEYIRQKDAREQVRGPRHNTLCQHDTVTCPSLACL
jgi:hypothetical protein